MQEAIKRPLYPKQELPTAHGDLEERLLTLDDPNNLPDYSTLPSSFNSTSTENYINWFSATCNTSSSFNELGAVIHVRKDPKVLIYPIRPHIGFDVIKNLDISRTQGIFSPVALAHSHPANSCFSQRYYGGDLGTAINGVKGSEGNNILIPVHILATPDDNFLLLRTKETKLVDNSDLFHISWDNNHLDEIIDYVRNGTEITRSLPEAMFKQLIARLEDLYYNGSGYGVYRALVSYYGVFAIAGECKMGFYHSNKDGQYTQVTEEFLDKLVKLRYEQALSATFQLLSQEKS